MTYICTGCGKTTLNITAGRGPCGKCQGDSHEFMPQKPLPANYTCKFCGHTSINAISGTCSKSPWKHHSYI